MLNASRVSMVTVQWTTIAWVICSALFALLPSYSYQMMDSSFHMIRTAGTADPRLTFGGFFMGLIFWNVVVYLGVQLFAWLWNRSADAK